MPKSADGLYRQQAPESHRHRYMAGHMVSNGSVKKEEASAARDRRSTCPNCHLRESENRIESIKGRKVVK